MFVKNRNVAYALGSHHLGNIAQIIFQTAQDNVVRQVVKDSTEVNSRTEVAVLSGLSAFSSSRAYQEFLSVSRRAMLSNAEK